MRRAQAPATSGQRCLSRNRRRGGNAKIMELEAGNRDFPLWLIADSNPAKWEARLSTPLDPRHPTRHNIWTPVLDEMQDGIYRASRQRIDTSGIYVRNALAE